LHRILVILAVAMSFTSASASASSAGAVSLAWTAPGEDSLTGRAYSYDLRYSTQSITAQNFVLASSAPSMPRPGVPGSTDSYVLTGLHTGVVYYFAIKTSDQAGNWSAMSNVIARVPQEVAGEPVGLDLSFSRPWPNPAREQARFACSLPTAGLVTVGVYDVAGRQVRQLVDEQRGPGLQEVAFDLRDDHGMSLSAGIYLVRARLGDTVFDRRLVVVR